MHGNRHDFSQTEGHAGHRRHHDPGQGHSDRGQHHGHGGRHGGGHHAHGRHDLHSGRKLSSADLQLILLALLADRPSHGYELIKSLEEHSHGLYVPSPGMIYPALTYLEEIGFASVETDGAKKRYSLTEPGRSQYEQNREAAGRILSDLDRIGAQEAQARRAMEKGSPEDSESGPMSEELESARHELRRSQRKKGSYTAEEAQGVADVLNRAAAEIRRLLAPPEVV